MKRTPLPPRTKPLRHKTEHHYSHIERGDAKGWESDPRHGGSVGGRQQPETLGPVPPPPEREGRSSPWLRPALRRAPLRQVSAKRRRQMAARRPAVAALLADRPWCGARLPGCHGRSVDGHELLRRSQGGDPTKPDRALCRPCHDYVTTHPAEAAALGLAVWSWQRPPMEEMSQR